MLQVSTIHTQYRYKLEPTTLFRHSTTALAKSLVDINNVYVYIYIEQLESMSDYINAAKAHKS